MDQRKTEACAAFLGGIERKEYLVPDTFWNAVAGICNGYTYMVVYEP
jgi:hypothetical protein